MNERNAELQAITDTINQYVDGLHTGNIETLKKAFHPKAMMYGVSAKAVTIVEIEGLYGLFQLITRHQKPASHINVL